MPRVALVTGAARGIGAATVDALVADGWSVVAVDSARDEPVLPYPMSTEAELEACASERVATYRADVRHLDALAGAVGLAEQRFGGLDVAISCAGVIGGGAPQWEVPVATEQAILDINLVGTLNLARVAVPAMLRQPEPRSGRFIAVASAAATRGMPMIAAYCAAKAGVTGLIKSLAVELGPHGVTANAVSPGSTDTEILAESARLYGLESPDEFAEQPPFGRLLQPREIAAVIAFLAGPGSSAMTGAIVPADAGLSL